MSWIHRCDRICELDIRDHIRRVRLDLWWLRVTEGLR